MGSICASLSVELGKPVSASRELSSQNIFIARHGKSALVELASIAGCLHATVTADSSGYLISRSKTDTKEIRDFLVSEHTGWIEQAIRGVEENRKQVLNPNSSITAEKVSQEFEKRVNQVSAAVKLHIPAPKIAPVADLLPSADLLVKLVRRIGAARIAEASLRGSAVFEDNPVSGNEILPNHLDLNAIYESEMLPLESAKLPPHVLGGNLTREFDVKPYALGWGVPLKPIHRLRLAVDYLGGAIVLALSGYDVGGSTVVMAQLTAPPMKATQAGPQTSLPSRTSSQTLREIPLSLEGTAAVAFAAMPSGKPLPFWFVHPDKREPLDLFVLTALQALASERPDRCVAIEVTDFLWDHVLHSSLTGVVNLDRFEELMELWSPFEWHSTADLAVWRPQDPYIQESYGADRRALSRFAGEAQREKQVSLRAASKLYRQGSVRPGVLTNLWEFYARVALDRWQTPGKNLTARIYRLIGAISDSDWSRLEGGKTLTVGELGAVDELKEALHQEFGVSPEGRYGYPDIYQHASELFTDDIYSRATLSVKAQTIPLIREPHQGEIHEMWAPIFAPNSTAFIVRPIMPTFKDGVFQAVTNRDQYEATLAQRHFRLGHSDSCTLTIDLPRGLWVEVCSSAAGIPDSKEIAYSDLPAELRDAFWLSACNDITARIKEIQAAGGVMSSQARSGSSPPPK